MYTHSLENLFTSKNVKISRINQFHSEKLHSIQLLDCTCDFICHLSKCQVVFQRALTLLAFQLHVLMLLKASQSCRSDS